MHFDGYQTIREAYGEGTTEEETAAATRQARMRNRGKTSEIDESTIGAMPADLPAPRVVDKKTQHTAERVNGSRSTHQTQTFDDESSDEKTLDGYQEIMSANSASSREEELQRMKEARMRNRLKASSLDEEFKW